MAAKKKKTYQHKNFAGGGMDGLRTARDNIKHDPRRAGRATFFGIGGNIAGSVVGGMAGAALTGGRSVEAIRAASLAGSYGGTYYGAKYGWESSKHAKPRNAKIGIRASDSNRVSSKPYYTQRRGNKTVRVRNK